MATAIWAKTESGDSYLWCIEDTLDFDAAKEWMKAALGDEADWVADFDSVNSEE